MNEIKDAILFLDIRKEEQMITYGTDLNDILVTGAYRVSNQMKADNNPRHYLIIPGIVVQQILDAERKKKKSDADEGDETGPSVIDDKKDAVEGR